MTSRSGKSVTINPGTYTAMESSTGTGELEPASIEPASIERASIEPASFEPTSKAAPAEVTPAEVQPSMVAVAREGCPVCGAAMASDQRYCVECGERRGPARVPLVDEPGQGARSAGSAATGRYPAAYASPRKGLSINSQLIAGIGVLLLALGIGVLIGRSGNSGSVKTPPIRVVTVAGAGTAAASPTTTQPESSSSEASKSKSGESHSTTTTKSTTKSTTKASTGPPPKTVKVGSACTGGKGCQNGHFTGNFFGEGE
jgi:hypothetical protein